MITVSYSGLTMYDNCPSSFQRKYILKEEVTREDKGNKARHRGTRLHNEIEAYLRGAEGTIDPTIAYLQPMLQMMREAEATPELKWSFDKLWAPCDFEDKENGRVRGILDAILYNRHEGVVEVYEWKSGRPYPDHEAQRSLYGMAGLLLYPEATKCLTTTLYPDTKKSNVTTLERSMLTANQWVWDRRINKTQPPQPYPLRPNWKCRWCDFSFDNGGKCHAGAK